MLRLRTGHPSTLTPVGPARPHEALTAAPGAPGAHTKTPPAHAQRTPSTRRCGLYPGVRLRLEPPTSLLWLVRGTVPTALCAHQRTNNGHGTGLRSQAGQRLTARPDGTAACGGLKPLSVRARCSLAGLTVARTLVEAGAQIVVLEARDRVGGAVSDTVLSS
jgi:hypothetical protein